MDELNSRTGKSLSEAQREAYNRRVEQYYHRKQRGFCVNCGILWPEGLALSKDGKRRLVTCQRCTDYRRQANATKEEV